MRPIDQWTDSERDAFRRACRDEGVNPQTHCPFCRRRAERRADGDGFCETHKDWQARVVNRACGHCQVRWGVQIRFACCERVPA